MEYSLLNIPRDEKGRFLKGAPSHKKTYWSISEENFIKENYKSKTYKEISEILNKKEYLVSNKVRSMGLKKLKLHFFTKEEIEIIKNNISINREKLSKMLNCKKSDLRTFIEKNELKKYSHWSKEDENFLKENYLILSNMEMSNILGRKNKYIQKKLSKSGFKRPPSLSIEMKIRTSAPACSKTLKAKYLRGETPKFIGGKGKDNLMFGKHQTLEHRNKISSAISGDKHYNWRGGIANEPYDDLFVEDFKDLIRERDGLSCVKCGLFQEDHLKIFNRKFDVHHINYDKKNTIPENCCSLCMRCHTETNHNREHWIKFFQSLLSERYGYKYDEKGNIILQIKNLEVRNAV